MKRIYSFLLACFTILVIMVATVPNMKDSIKTSAEYQEGYEVVYKLSNIYNEEEGVTEDEAKKAAELMQKRITSRLSADSSVVNEEDGNLRVFLVSDDYSEATNLLDNYIEYNKVVTVGDETYPERYTFNELFDMDSADMKMISSAYGIDVTLTVKASKDGAKKLEKLKEDGKYDLSITIWDDYYGETKDDEGKSTVISNSTYKDGKIKISWSASSNETLETALAQSFAIEHGHLGVNLEQTSMVKHEASFEKYTLVKFFISIAVVVVLVSLIFVRFYKKAGLLGSILTVFATAFTLILFYWFNGTYSLLSCLGIVASIGLSADLFVGITHKIRASLYKGRNVVKAFNEGYFKSLPMIIDTLLIVAGASIVMYYAGNGDVKSLALMLFSSILSSTLFISFGYFMSGYFLLGSVELQNQNLFNINKEMIVSLNSDVVKSNEDTLYGTKFNRWYKLFLPVMLVIMVVAVALGTTLKLTDHNMVNFSDSYATNYVLRINVDDDAFNSKSNALKVLKDIDLEYDEVKYGTSTIYDEDENLVSSYVISFYGEDDSLVENKAKVIEAVKAIVGEDYEDAMVYASTYETPLVTSNNNKVISAIGFIVLFLVVYFLIRYGVRMTVSTLVGGAVAAASYLAFVILTRLPFNFVAVQFLPLIVLLAFLFSSYVFEKAKAVVKENKEYTKDDLVKTIGGSVNYRFVMSLYVYALVILVLIAMSNSLTILTNVLSLIAVMVAILSSMFVSFKLWVVFYLKTKHISFRKGKKFKKIKIKPLSGEPQEYTFTGIND